MFTIWRFLLARFTLLSLIQALLLFLNQVVHFHPLLSFVLQVLLRLLHVLHNLVLSFSKGGIMSGGSCLVDNSCFSRLRSHELVEFFSNFLVALLISDLPHIFLRVLSFSKQSFMALLLFNYIVSVVLICLTCLSAVRVNLYSVCEPSRVIPAWL